MKNFASLTVVLLLVFSFMGGVAQAEQHGRLLPLLGDLVAWQAQPAHGMSLVSAQMKMISANRTYTQADKSLTLTIMINSGPVVDSDLQESSFENEATRFQARQIDGFWVKSSHSKPNGSGEVIVYLDYNQEANCLLKADYEKMNDDEVLQIIRSMNLEKFKKVVSTLL